MYMQERTFSYMGGRGIFPLATIPGRIFWFRANSTDVSHVGVQCVHQHTAPSGDEAEDAFFEELTDRVSAAARRSLRKMCLFDSIGIGQAKVERVASTRRIPTEDGTVRGRASRTKGRPELRELPEGYIDPLLKDDHVCQRKRAPRASALLRNASAELLP